MDQATEYLLLQEAELSKALNNLRGMIPNVQKVFLKPNKNTLKALGNRLKGREFKFIERDAIRRIPGFKKDYLEAQRKTPRLNFATAATSKAIALCTALVSSTTGRSVDDVIKRGAAGIRNSKIMPGPSIVQLIMLGLFISFIISIFLTDGAIVMPTIQAALSAIGLLVLAIGQIIKALFKVAGWINKGDATATATGSAASEDPGSFWDATFNTPSGIEGDVGLINPEAMMDWIFKALGF
jgi:hypothetical protein